MYARNKKWNFVIGGLLLIGFGFIELIGIILDPPYKPLYAITNFLVFAIPGTLLILYGMRFCRSVRMMRKLSDNEFMGKLCLLKDWELLLCEKNSQLKTFSLKRRLLFAEMHSRGLVDKQQLGEQKLEKLFFQKLSSIKFFHADGVFMSRCFICISWCNGPNEDTVIIIKNILSVNIQKRSISSPPLFFFFTNDKDFPFRVLINDMQLDAFQKALEKTGVIVC